MDDQYNRMPLEYYQGNITPEQYQAMLRRGSGAVNPSIGPMDFFAPGLGAAVGLGSGAIANGIGRFLAGVSREELAKGGGQWIGRGAMGAGAGYGALSGLMNNLDARQQRRIDENMPPQPYYGAQPPLESQMPPVPDYPPHVPPNRAAIIRALMGK